MALTTAGIPTLINYFDAKRHYDSVKPLNGNSKYAGQRPLGKNRRYTNCMISERQAGDIVLWLCENPLVIFTPDNKILIGSCAYPTHLTTSFLNEVFERSNLFQYVQKVRSQLHIRGADGVNYPIPNDKSYITYDLAQGKFVNMNPVRRYRARTSELKRMLSNYATFLDYCKSAMFLLGTEGLWNYKEADEKFVSLYGVNADRSLQHTALNTYAVRYKPELARSIRTAFLKELDSSVAKNEPEDIYKRFIDMCILTRLKEFSYDDIKRVLIDLLKFEYPHLLFYIEEVYPSAKIATNNNEFYVKYCGSKELIDKLTSSQNV